jgi:hypothetical protein
VLRISAFNILKPTPPGGALAWALALLLAATLQLPLTRAAQATDFTPNTSNDTEVISRGWSDEEVAQILADFRTKHRHELGPIFSFQTHSTTANEVRITFPYDIQPMLLAMLVSYLQYPEKLEAPSHPIAVLGHVTLTSAFALPSPSYAGRRARIYVPVNDTGHDVICVAVDATFYEQSLKNGEWIQVTDGRIPPAVQQLW